MTQNHFRPGVVLRVPCDACPFQRLRNSLRGVVQKDPSNKATGSEKPEACGEYVEGFSGNRV